VLTVHVEANGSQRAVALNRSVKPEAIYAMDGDSCVVSSVDDLSWLYGIGSEEQWEDYPQLVESNGRAPGAP
jgi:hypothetical protein